MYLVAFIIMIISSVWYTWRRLREQGEQSDSALDEGVAAFTSFPFNLAVAIAGFIFLIRSVFKLRG